MDLDHFKSVNDSCGHAMGDAVIEQSVGAAIGRLRESDLCGRLGGEEFAFILPHTDRGAASDVAEQIRRSIEELVFDSNGKQFRMTASFGIAALDRATQDFEELLAKADAALYEAKKAGRNRCRTVEASGDGRDVARRRVLKGGQIIFNNRMSTVDCTVRSLSDAGAGIDVSSAAGLPKDFILAIRADGVEIPSRITAWSDRHIEVEFLKRAA
jgi:diguanylate cyclase (GGDEF)-like protein